MGWIGGEGTKNGGTTTERGGETGGLGCGGDETIGCTITRPVPTPDPPLGEVTTFRDNVVDTDRAPKSAIPPVEGPNPADAGATLSETVVELPPADVVAEASTIEREE